MTAQASGTFEIKQWEEAPYDEREPKLVRATVSESYSGDIEGDAALVYLLTYLPDGSARFTGQIHLTGRIGGRQGSFVLHETGVYEGGNTAKGTVTILPGSGTGELTGLRGEGTYVATHGEKPVEFAGRVWEPTSERIASYILDYEFE